MSLTSKTFQSKGSSKHTIITATTLAVVIHGITCGQAIADEAGASTINANTGVNNGGVIGNNSGSFNDVGIGVNGNLTGNANNNQNTAYAQNQNMNAVQSANNVYVPSQAAGGNSAIILPRNPLPLPNANLGRSNFGLQFGVNNHPYSGTFGGSSNALGWFMQAGLVIPFGKIPKPLIENSRMANMLDNAREQQMSNSRNVFARPVPPNGQLDGRTVETKVQGRVQGLSAYNFATIPADKMDPNAISSAASTVGRPFMTRPKVIALAPGSVYSRPLNTGETIGNIEVGQEYPYLGHTKSGWVKVVLQNGKEGWSKASFEYLKYDFTEIDDLASLNEPVKESPKTKLVANQQSTGKQQGTH
jgi:hypothetical protein